MSEPMLYAQYDRDGAIGLFAAESQRMVCIEGYPPKHSFS